MTTRDLESTAREILADGKGILAADESTGTITKRFEAVGVDSTEQTRRRFRDLMFATGDVERWLGGVILYDETLRQSMSDGTPMAEHLVRRGIVPGIKVDKGAKALAGSPDEKVTEGLDGLRERFAEYREMGARFAKWRSVITVTDQLPTLYALEVNAHVQARYAALAQEAGLVPILEPEAIMDGDHSIERSFEVTEAMLHAVFEQVHLQRVVPEGMLLKTNMVVSGYAGRDQAGPGQVAESTIRCLRRTVPPAVPGVVFLSGGQDDVSASANLNEISKARDLPWIVSFSYARALQGQAMQAWAGREDSVSEAQEAFHRRAKLTAAANRGEWTPDVERQPELVG